MAEKIMEEGWTGVEASFTARVGGSTPLPVATTVLPLEAINAEFAMAPRV